QLIGAGIAGFELHITGRSTAKGAHGNTAVIDVLLVKAQQQLGIVFPEIATIFPVVAVVVLIAVGVGRERLFFRPQHVVGSNVATKQKVQVLIELIGEGSPSVNIIFVM